jgi:hypothetical protein
LKARIAVVVGAVFVFLIISSVKRKSYKYYCLIYIYEDEKYIAKKGQIFKIEWAVQKKVD